MPQNRKQFREFLLPLFKNMASENSQKFSKKFRCEKCDYSSVRSSDFKKHLQSKRHNDNKMVTNDNKMLSYDNINSKNKCDCGKVFKYRSGLSRHIGQCQKVINDNKMVITGNKMITAKYECKCGKIYKFKSGLSRHRQRCTYTKSDELVTYKDLKMVLKDMIPQIQGNIIGSNNNSNNVVNKTEQINIFLNNECANAMSIQDFASQLTFTMDDLNMNKPACLTNVLLKNIQPLNIGDRPFHCSNINNKEWHIKDEKEGWEKDNGEKIIKKAEQSIIKRWREVFEKDFPDWEKDEGLKDTFVKITTKALGNMEKKAEAKVLKDVGEEVLVEF